MRAFLGAVGVIFGVLLLVLALGWVVQGNDFFLYRTFAPKYEQTRREVYEQTPSYRHGMVQELQNMQFEYEKAAPEHKAALRKIILRRAADYPDQESLPPDLYGFIQRLKREETGR